MCSSPLGERWGQDCTGKGRGGILPACEIVVFPVTLIIGSGWDFLLTSGWQVGFCCSWHPGAILVSEGHQSIFPWDFLWALKERVVVACDDSRRHRSFLGGVLVCCWGFFVVLFCFAFLHSPAFSVWWLPAMVPPQWSLCSRKSCGGRVWSSPWAAAAVWWMNR